MGKRRGKIKKRTIKCSHYKGEGYYYELNKKEDLSLCCACHLNLASGIMGQLAINIFAEDLLRKEEIE